MRKLISYYLLLKVHLITILLLIHPTNVLSETIDEASFRLYLNKEVVKYIPVLLISDHIYLNLEEYLKALEYQYNRNMDAKTLNTCYPNKRCAFSVKGTLIEGDSLKYNYPSKMVIWNEDALYVDIDFIKSISPFPIKVATNSLSLMIEAKPDEEIPYVKWAIIKKKYNRPRNIDRTLDIDTLSLRFFRLNSLGYALTGRAVKYANSNALSLNSMGMANGELLGGQFNVQYTHLQSTQIVSPDIYTFNWNKQNLNSKILKQYGVFRSNSNLIIPSPFFTTGIFFSNIPNIGAEYKNYQLNGKTTPDTQVEVYNNRQMVKIITSDSIGEYQTEIPISGGNNNISTIAYDDYGNSFGDNRVYFLPPNLEAEKKFSYKISTGVVDYKDPYYQAITSYGLTSRITLSVGSEGIWHERKQLKRLDIFTLKTHLLSYAPIEINYIPNFKWSINGNLNPINGFNVYYNYQSYDPSQTIIDNLLKSYNVGINGRIPLIGLNNSFFISVQSNKYTTFSFFNSNLNISTNYRNLWSGISVTSNSTKEFKFEELIFGLKNGYNISKNLFGEAFVEYSPNTKYYRLRGRMQYHRTNKCTFFVDSNWDSWQQNYNISLGVYYNFSTFGLRSVANKGKAYSSTDVSVMGSMNFRQEKSPVLSPNMTLGNHILVIPFLDINGNGIYDKNEPVISDIKITSNASGQIVRKKNGINIINITPNRVFSLKIPKQTLREISWQIKDQEYDIFMHSYQTRTIKIPIQIYSELSGSVSVKKGVSKKTNKLQINITGIDNDKKFTTTVDEWGDYNISTLTPGSYAVTIDNESLTKSQLQISSKNTIEINVPISKEGVEIDDMNFKVE